MKDLFHYTLKKNIKSILETGLFRMSKLTKQEYFDPRTAGQMCGVRSHYIDIVLKFSDDGRFRSVGITGDAERFSGGADEWFHLSRPKPVAYRNINERLWRKL